VRHPTLAARFTNLAVAFDLGQLASSYVALGFLHPALRPMPRRGKRGL